MIKWIPWYPESPLPEPALVTKIGRLASSHRTSSFESLEADKPSICQNLFPFPVVPLYVICLHMTWN